MRYLTAGESHGPQLTTIIEGVPAGLYITTEDIDYELQRRQKGHGRGRRMQIEKDQARITSGVRHGRSLGSPDRSRRRKQRLETLDENHGIRADHG
jgi:chorismate synthase